MKYATTRVLALTSAVLLFAAGSASANEARLDTRALKSEPSVVVLVHNAPQTTQVKTPISYIATRTGENYAQNQSVSIETTIELSEVKDFDMHMIEIELERSNTQEELKPVFSAL